MEMRAHERAAAIDTTAEGYTARTEGAEEVCPVHQMDDAGVEMPEIFDMPDITDVHRW